MLEIIWALLNIGLLIYFFVLIFKAVRLVREHLGLFASIVMVIGLIGIFSSGKSTEKEDDMVYFMPKNEVNTLKNTKKTRHYLEQNASSSLYMYMKLQSATNQPIYGNIRKTGLVAGRYWKTKSIDVQKVTPKTIHCTVDGCYEWKLIGLLVYSEYKVFSVEVPSK